MAALRILAVGFVATVVVFLLRAGAQDGLAPGAPDPSAALASGAAARSALARLPIRFEPNRGQTDSRVRFVAHLADESTLFLTSSGATLALDAGSRRAVVTSRLVGARRSPEVPGRGVLAGTSNYLLGSDPRRWQTAVPGYAAVQLAGVYPGIDLVYHGRSGQLEYDFDVAPGADAAAIRLAFDGTRSMSIGRAGD